MAHPFINMN